jgi:hypothetical protein
VQKKQKKESGQAIVESVIAMLLLCLILFGLLQMFSLIVAQMSAEFSTFYTAKSKAVGFADYLVQRNARSSIVASSGNITWPEQHSFSTPMEQFGVETFRIPEYNSGRRWLEYENWRGDNDEGTTVSQSSVSSAGIVRTKVGFRDFPLNFPMRSAFTTSESVDIQGEASLIDYSEVYLRGD